MSIKRYEARATYGLSVGEDERGEFVRYDDHAAEIKRLAEEARLAGMQADQNASAVNELQAEVERLRGALRRLLLDVQDYPAWQRPCAAVDEARATLEGEA